MSFTTSSNGVRPTLPSLHTLGLLPDALSIDNISLSGSPANSSDWQNDFARWRRERHSSISSTTSSCTTSTSRSTSPSDSNSVKQLRVSASDPSSQSSPQSNTFSMVLTTFDKANAFVVVPPSAPYVPNISSYSRSASSSNSEKRYAQRNRALLLVGPAVEHLRHPRLRIAKGARVHPYRIVASPARRTSTSSQSSDSSMSSQ